MGSTKGSSHFSAATGLQCLCLLLKEEGEREPQGKEGAFSNEGACGTGGVNPPKSRKEQSISVMPARVQCSGTRKAKLAENEIVDVRGVMKEGRTVLM